MASIVVSIARLTRASADMTVVSSSNFSTAELVSVMDRFDFLEVLPIPNLILQHSFMASFNLHSLHGYEK